MVHPCQLQSPSQRQGLQAKPGCHWRVPTGVQLPSRQLNTSSGMVRVLVTGSNGSAGRCAVTGIQAAGCVPPRLPFSRGGSSATSLTPASRRGVALPPPAAPPSLQHTLLAQYPIFGHPPHRYCFLQPLGPRVRPRPVRRQGRRCLRSHRESSPPQLDFQGGFWHIACGCRPPRRSTTPSPTISYRPSSVRVVTPSTA